jgi:hypothetical protein
MWQACPHNARQYTTYSWFVSDAYAEDMQMPTYASTCSRHSGKHIKYACARILRHMRVHTYSQTQADTDILEGVGRKCHNSRTCTLVPQLAHMHTSATTRAHAHQVPPRMLINCHNSCACTLVPVLHECTLVPMVTSANATRSLSFLGKVGCKHACKHGRVHARRLRVKLHLCACMHARRLLVKQHLYTRQTTSRYRSQ